MALSCGQRSGLGLVAHRFCDCGECFLTPGPQPYFCKVKLVFSKVTCESNWMVNIDIRNAFHLPFCPSSAHKMEIHTDRSMLGKDNQLLHGPSLLLLGFFRLGARGLYLPILSKQRLPSQSALP